jgi:hypothetical protein
MPPGPPPHLSDRRVIGRIARPAPDFLYSMRRDVLIHSGHDPNIGRGPISPMVS